MTQHKAVMMTMMMITEATPPKIPAVQGTQEKILVVYLTCAASTVKDPMLI